MYYGNSGCTSQQLPEKTWDLNYKMVQHLKEGAGSPAKDSTLNGNDGTIYGASWVTSSILGYALEFDGIDDYIGFSSPVLNNPPYTVCVWVKPDTITGDYMYIIDNGGGYNYGYGFYIQLREDTDEWQFGGKRSDKYHGNRNYPAQSTDWTFMCGSWDGVDVTHIKLYINGESVGKQGNSNPDPGADPYNLKIGISIFNNYPFDGLIDEIRISNNVRSADWIKTSYNTMNDPSGFLSINPEETGP
jgi:hypothetical protein